MEESMLQNRVIAHSNSLSSKSTASLDSAKCWQYIVKNGTPSSDEILLDIRNFFEGPINLDLMMLGAAKNLATDDQSIGLDKLKKEGMNLLQTIGLSAIATQTIQ